ncbi:Hypothetical protein A7982_02809 [Minicystis rosea]|nr:Hypothetical protein A7982_02809 [Minicystis rosea]
MNLQQFAQTCVLAKVMLFGESHDDPSDARSVLQIVNIFELRGHALSFYFEHFPGEEMNAALGMVSSGRLTPQDFLQTLKFDLLTFQGEKRLTPEEYWEHPAESQKLIALMRYAQQHYIPLAGHDVYQTDFSREGTRDWNAQRDTAMVAKMVQDRGGARSGLQVGFLGKLHVLPQAAMLRGQYFRRAGEVITLIPMPRDAGGLAIVPNPEGGADDYLFTR